MDFEFKCFLSHKYAAPEVNLYFFNLFSEVARVQFAVDGGTFSTSVTRLERMVRDADAFIGIYPFTGTGNDALENDKLKEQSRYFRLEMALATRSQKPAVIFYDKRYGDLLKPPAGMLSYAFDLNEVAGTGGSPNRNKHKKLFSQLSELVKVKKAQEEIELPEERTSVAIFCSQFVGGSTADQIANGVRSVLARRNYGDVSVFTWPFVLDNQLFKILRRIDFAIVFLTGEMISSGLPAYLHGAFVPVIRLQKKEAWDRNYMFDFLYGGFEAGYPKDLVTWESEEQLFQQLTERLDLIKTDRLPINTYGEAEKYFLAAARQNKAVFLSYSGKDQEIGRDIATELRRRFEKVFDYRDKNESLLPGSDWMTEIYRQLSSSAVGISLLSKDYLSSGHCLHEMNQMIAKRDEGKMTLFPIKLYQESLVMPDQLSATQYLRKVDYDSTKSLIKKVVDSLPTK